MKKILLIVLPFVLFMTVRAIAPYDRLWNEVDKLETEGLPRSVIEKVDSVSFVAKEEGAYDEYLKALIYKAKSEYSIDEESLPANIRAVSDFARSCPDSVVAAIACMRVAELYSQFMEAHRHELPQGGITEAEGNIPLELWSAEMFRDTIGFYIDKAIENRDCLRNVGVGRYTSLLKSGKDYNLRPSVYNVLVHKAIDVFSIVDESMLPALYDSLVLGEKGRKEAYSMAVLERNVYEGADLDEFITANADRNIVVYAFYLKALAMDDKQAAFNLCKNVKAAYSGNRYMPFIDNLMSAWSQPFVRATAQAYIYPGQRAELNLEYRNVEGVSLEVYKINMSASEYERYRYKSVPEDKLSLVSKYNYPLRRTSEIAENDTIVHFDLPGYGLYRYKLSASGINYDEGNMGDVCVSRFELLSQSRGEVLHCKVVDRENGKLQKGIDLRLLHDGKIVNAGITDADGSAEFKGLSLAESYKLLLSCGEDSFYMPERVVVYRNNEIPETVRKAVLFTDRKIYRPGQTVYFKAVVYDEGMESKSVLPEEKVELSISNPQRAEVMKHTYVSNDFGSFAGSYKIPLQAVSGRYMLSAGGSSDYFEVQDYKRASFNPYIDDIQGTYACGDTINVNIGVNAYSGQAVAGAKLAVVVARRPLLFWRSPLGRRTSEQVFSDTLAADGEGKAKLALALACEGGDTGYVYDVSVSATSSSGETQTATKSIVTDKRAFEILPDLKDIYEKSEGVTFSVECINSDGQEVHVNMSYALMQDGDTVYTEETVQCKSVSLLGVEKLTPGRYGLTVSATDEKGRVETVSRSFLLFDTDSKKLPVDTLLWVRPLNSDYADAEEFVFQIGSSRKTDVICNLYGMNGLIDYGTLRLSDNIKTYRIKKKTWYPPVSRFEVIAVGDGETLIYNKEINCVPEARKINLKVSTSRDVVEPGTCEQWQITAAYQDGSPANAEILLLMYDLALDRLAPNLFDWRIGRNYGMFFPSWRWQSGNVSTYISAQDYIKPVYDFEFPFLRDFGFVVRPHYLVNLGMPMLTAQRSKASDKTVSDESVAAGTAAEDDQIRSELAETAFFLPQLQCDSAGSATFMFTTPGDITSWKIMAAAHTKDLSVGLWADTIISRKILSAVQYLPRFVRAGDEVVFKLQAENLSDSTINADLSWKISSCVGGTVLQLKDSAFVLKPGESKAVGQSFAVPSDVDFLVLETRLSGGGFSDGERRYLQVLPKQILVTESKNLAIPNSGSYVFGLDGFAAAESATMQPESIVLEFCSNPAWAALLSLPYITDADVENSIEIASAIFANAKLYKVYSENVQYRSFLNVCGELPENPSLSANKEVTISDISSTPWLQEALQLSQLPELLDSRRASGLLGYYGDKLKKMQLESGAFPWFEGGAENIYASLQVADLIKDLPVFSDEYSALSKYLENALAEDMKAKRPVSSEILKIMQHCCNYDEEAYKYYLRLAFSDLSRLSCTDKALAAVAAKNAGDSKNAAAAVESLRQYAVSDDYSMYWNKDGGIAGHIAIMQAFAFVDPQSDELQKMGYYLLCHKRYNKWDDAATTAKAVDLLLGERGETLFYLDDGLDVSVNGQSLQPEENAMPGYFNAVFRASEIDLDNCRIEVSKHGDGQAWGAAYFVYTEDADKVKSSDSGLRLEKLLYKLLPDGSLQLVDAGTVLQAGDRLRVRLVVKAKAEMDFVCLKDFRAAGMEPVLQKSARIRQGDLWCYFDLKDDCCSFYFDNMPKGTHVIEYDMFAGVGGRLNSGPAQIQCLYNPLETSNAPGVRIVVSE